MHQSGYAMLDLKPDNILVGDCDNENLHKIRLVDFGVSRPFNQEDGSHIKLEKQDQFIGSMTFSSVNGMSYLTQSRRDDLISLCYVLVYMMNRDLPFII